MGSCTGKCSGNSKHLIEPTIISPKTVFPMLNRHMNKNQGFFEPTRRRTQVVEATNATITERGKSDTEMNLIHCAIMQHFLFTNLTPEMRVVMVDKMKWYELQQGDIVFNQGDPANNFFVVAVGKLEIRINGRIVKQLEQGDSFGELALINDAPRSATIRSLNNVFLWGLQRDTFQDVLTSLNSQLYEENRSFIDSVPLFSILTPNQKETIVSSLTSLKFTNGHNIVNEGDAGDLFFLIVEGKVLWTWEGRELRHMERGDFFGEQALLYNSPRTATVTAWGEVRWVALSREQLAKVLGNQLQQVIYQRSITIAMEQNPILWVLSKEEMIHIGTTMTVESYYQGDMIEIEGKPKAEELLIILKGKVAIDTIYHEKGACLGDSEVTGESDELWYNNIVVHEDLDIARISKESFEEWLGGTFACVSSDLEAMSVLRKVELLKGISNEKYHALINTLQAKTYSDKEVIVAQDNEGDIFYIVKEGRVDVFRNKQKIRTITKHDYFGERSVLFKTFRSATAIADGNVTCWELHQSDFLDIIDDAVRQILTTRINLQDDSIALRHLVPIKQIGKGMFGQVYLCYSDKNKQFYALKTVTRKKIDYHGISENLLQERQILLMIDHTMIMKLVKTFKDNERVYFLTEFINGMDLFDTLRKIGLCKDSDAKFYTASLMLALEHLFERNIVHRDLKPENIMVDQDGYLKIIDFGTAKVVKARTFTILGTPHYMAPEVLMGKGYSFPADLWSLGVMLYEFICGSVPFGEDMSDTYKIYEQILNRNLEYPRFVGQKFRARPLIEKLLNRNPAYRGDPIKLKQHKYFTNFNWNNLISRKSIPPYKKRAQEIEPPQPGTSDPLQLFDMMRKVESDERDIKLRHKAPMDWDAEF